VLSDDKVELTDAELVAEYFDLDPSARPWENFDLSDWALDTPDSDNGPIMDSAGNIFGNGDTFSARTQDFHFVAGAMFPGSEPFFLTGSDGAMVFKSTVFGARTSQNTSFVRSELREMLRAGDANIATQGVTANNWALDHQPFNPNIAASGGRLTATLSIDQVTSTGSASQVGRVIIGQIHASGDEPMRLYYRKLPGNTKGSIYAAHEIRDSNDILFDMLGSRSDSAADPIEDGISLGELFSYEIINVGSTLEVIIRRGDSDGEIISELTIDMLTANVGGTSSGYERADEWMYFKAGAYSQNNTGWANDFDQVRFYRLDNSH
jgi:poly(beta-D-mannuronate) lyase